MPVRHRRLIPRRPSEPRPERELPRPLLYSRRHACALLGGISTATLIRLENDGVIEPIKLGRSPTGQTFYRAADVHAH